MKVITFSRYFPKGHPKAGEPTWFVEKIWKGIWDAHNGISNPLHPWWVEYDKWFPSEGKVFENIHENQPKLHTIRTGHRFKPGETISLRIWSGRPYCSKQVEFAQVEVKQIWNILINEFWFVNDKILEHDEVAELAKNDGLELKDFTDWFAIHPKKKGEVFEGQIIAWRDVDY